MSSGSRRFEALERMEDKILEAELRQEAKRRQHEFETMEERGRYRTGASEDEESQYKNYEYNDYEGTTTSKEEIGRPSEDAERGNNFSNGDNDVDRDYVRGSGVSKANEWESVRSDGNEDTESLEME